MIRGDIIKNPYSKLINHMREQGGKNNTPYVQLGTVVVQDPLTIKFGDLQIGKDNLFVSQHLLPYGLEQGDTVALAPSLDEQTYIVLAKVVRP